MGVTYATVSPSAIDPHITCLAALGVNKPGDRVELSVFTAGPHGVQRCINKFTALFIFIEQIDKKI